MLVRRKMPDSCLKIKEIYINFNPQGFKKNIIKLNCENLITIRAQVCDFMVIEKISYTLNT